MTEELQIEQVKSFICSAVSPLQPGQQVAITLNNVRRLYVVTLRIPHQMSEVIVTVRLVGERVLSLIFTPREGQQATFLSGRVLIWFSCGAASAVAAKLALEKYPDALVVYCDTSDSEHDDNQRFMSDVSQWLDRQIISIKSEKYSSVDDVFEKRHFMSGPAGAICTVEMKKVPRTAFQSVADLHVFGFTADEADRIEQFERSNPELYLEWVLRDHGITKDDCYQIISTAGIALPAMYSLGFDHNNCWGCVKATSPGYWNRVRRHNPLVFHRRCVQSRNLGVKLVRVAGERIFLDELEPGVGINERDGDIDCGPFCQTPEAHEP